MFEVRVLATAAEDKQQPTLYLNAAECSSVVVHSRQFEADFQRTLCRVPAGSVDLILSYCHHSLNDKSLRDLLPLLREKGVGVVNGSVLSMGLLTSKVRCTEFCDLLPDQVAAVDHVPCPFHVNKPTAEGAQCANIGKVTAASSSARTTQRHMTIPVLQE